MVPEGPERLFWQVLSISIVTTSSFNPVVSIKTMFHFVATMSFQEFHFPFHNDRRSWRQHFLSMNRGGKAEWYNVDLPFLLQGLGPSFCSIPQYWPLKILLIFVFQYGDFGGGVHGCHCHCHNHHIQYFHRRCRRGDICCSQSELGCLQVQIHLESTVDQILFLVKLVNSF